MAGKQGGWGMQRGAAPCQVPSPPNSAYLLVHAREVCEQRSDGSGGGVLGLGGSVLRIGSCTPVRMQQRRVVQSAGSFDTP